MNSQPEVKNVKQLFFSPLFFNPPLPLQKKKEKPSVACQDLPSRSSFTSLAAFSPSSRRFLSIIFDLSAAALSSALTVQPMAPSKLPARCPITILKDRKQYYKKKRTVCRAAEVVSRRSVRLERSYSTETEMVKKAHATDQRNIIMSRI